VNVEDGNGHGSGGKITRASDQGGLTLYGLKDCRQGTGSLSSEATVTRLIRTKPQKWGRTGTRNTLSGNYGDLAHDFSKLLDLGLEPAGGNFKFKMRQFPFSFDKELRKG